MDDNAEPSPFARSVWQISTYLTGAALVATWIWVWNTSGELRDLHNTLQRVPELFARSDSNRSIIESSAQRISKLEDATLRGKDDRDDLRVQNHELREAVDNTNRAMQELRIEQGRLMEAMRQFNYYDGKSTPTAPSRR